MNQKTLKYYQDNAKEYVQFSSLANLEKQHQRFLTLLPKDSHRILDLGFGGGRDSLYFQNLEFSVTSLDGCPAFVEHGKEIGLKDVVLKDIESISYDNEFDGIWANASLLHLPKEMLPGIFARLFKSLKKGGLLYCSFKSGEYQGMRDGRFYTDLKKQDLMEFSSSAGFTLIEMDTDDDSLKRDCLWLECYLRK